MYNLDWEDLKVLWAVTTTGSLSQAAALLESTQPTVGRRLSALEARAGVTLVARSPRGCTLTMAGEALRPWLEQMMASAEGLSQAMSVARADLEGVVRIACGELVGYHLSSRLGSLLERAPRLEVSLLAGFDSVNLARGEAEIAIRAQVPTGDQWVVKRLKPSRFVIYGSQAYIKANPAAYDERERFVSCRWLELKGAGSARWINERIDARATRLSFDRSLIVVEAAAAGLGLALLPLHTGDRVPQLMRLSEPVEGYMLQPWLVMSSSAARLERVRLVSRWLQEVLGEVHQSAS